MYKQLPIIILIVLTFTKLQSQCGGGLACPELHPIVNEELKYHIYNLKNQKRLKRSMYERICETGKIDFSTYFLADSVLSPYVTNKINTILNPNKFIVAVNNIQITDIIRWEDKRNGQKIEINDDICQSNKLEVPLLDNLYIWLDFQNLTSANIEIFIDNSIDIERMSNGITQLINNIFTNFNCENCISFITVDIEEIKNEQI
ncbi:uncharacterized protein METZ01_LOCUS482914, partial [marine metagenome]